MKIRQSFVSNSSSSSFLIGIGIVRNEAAFHKELYDFNTIKAHAGGFPGLKIIKIKDLVNEQPWYARSNAPGNIKIESFTGDYVSADISDCDPEDYVVMFRSASGDADHLFWDEESGEYDYDIDESFFEGSEATLIDIMNFKSIDGEYRYGAGRDG